MRSSHKHQMSRHDLTTGDRHKGGCCGRVEAPAAFHKHQDRSALRRRAGFFVRRTLLDGSSSQHTSRSFIAPAFSLPGSGDPQSLTAGGRSRRGGCATWRQTGTGAVPCGHGSDIDPAIRLTRHKFVRAVMAARRHFVHQPRWQALADVTHVQRLSAFVGFNTDEHTERACGTVLYSTGDFLEMQGAPQHECG